MEKRRRRTYSFPACFHISQPAGAIISSKVDLKYTTAEWLLYALPKYAVPVPVTLQYLNTKPLVCVSLSRPWAVI